MGLIIASVVGFLLILSHITAYKYDPNFVEWNLNENQFAVEPTDYWGEWKNHKYHESPENWRFPFYTVFLDRLVNGDPTNDNINGTFFEHDISSNQMRHGGDLLGLVDTLDYIHGTGIRGIYLAGSPFINLPWEYDGYSPADLTLLDQHLGTIEIWRTAVTEIHARGMYVILDSTFATMSDLIGFDGYLNVTTPFTLKEHKVQYKTSRQYLDFSFGNDYNETCNYPPFWNETGFPIDSSVRDRMKGCYNSEFDQYGDTEAFGVFPDWRRELSKFASVQDRLREWHPPVRAKLENFYCMVIAQLDIDGFRYDKATQSTVDAMGYMNDAMRKCARRFNKNNFFVPGEITSGNDFGSIFLGRGRQPNMLPDSILDAVTMTNRSGDQYFLRSPENGALDAAAFHYTVYRTLTRFLGMDGNLEAGYDAPPNWVDMWNVFLLTNDFINANTGKFDPRHMYGVTNQDVFRWPAVTNGVQRQLLGHFITILLMPGVPLLLWGEEQAFYILDSTADNYIYGRQPMSSSTAWQDHGCYSLGSAQFYDWPVASARHGCGDDAISLDHRDPASPVRNILRHMYQLRQDYTVLNDGFFLQQLSNQTKNLYYPGSSGVPTETGLWSVVRMGYPGVQSLGDGETSNQPVWLVFSNLNESKTYEFDCSDNATGFSNRGLISPFDGEVSLQNILPPYDIQHLENSRTYLGLQGSTNPNGCLRSLDMEMYGFRAYVPLKSWKTPHPTITKFSPGHDARIKSRVQAHQKEDLQISFEFSAPMDCQSVTNSLTFDSAVLMRNEVPTIRAHSVKCETWTDLKYPPGFQSSVASAWIWSGTLENVKNGVHTVTVRNASTESNWGYTNSVDHFMFRIGQEDNPMVFPRTANYSSSLLTKDPSGQLFLQHKATGADLWRYSTNWGTTFSDWTVYGGGTVPIELQSWNGTTLQRWQGDHVRVEYWSRLTGSSDHVQEGDTDWTGEAPRRFPHLFLNGPFNQFGFDNGPSNEMQINDAGLWEFSFSTEWPAIAQVNVWGMDPDGLPDQTCVMGDVDGDSILDRLPPSYLAPVVLNITVPPPEPYLSWSILIDDGSLRYQVIPAGSMWTQLTLYVLLFLLPILAAGLGVWLFMRSFYAVKFNQVGIREKKTKFLNMFRRLRLSPRPEDADEEEAMEDAEAWWPMIYAKLKTPSPSSRPSSTVWDKVRNSRILSGSSRSPSILEKDKRTILIATMEYDIEDWEVKVKIGGLGVMAQLMGKHLTHQDLIWVVPCVGGIEYPVDQRAPPMAVKIFGNSHLVEVQYHRYKNITYVLLDAPTFRRQTKAEPYPARMDDFNSAVYYSAWNQCIAQAIDRFSIDLYHINDYHGCVAPLYLLPSTIPVCLSLHNAEFQGLWPMRTRSECEEVSGIFNLPMEAIQKYVQFGEVFNLLHAGASYLRVHQNGFGAVGVSEKYGARSRLRYPIFWGLKKVGQLPNPDPSDTGEWDGKLPKDSDISVNQDFEASRPELKRQAQEWAGLDQNPTAELMVFVGRWSMQKGIDLIADVFPAVLKAHPSAQLICVGPVIDLYGKFAALKLQKLMQLYPGRVSSKPVFTALPPFIFSGAEFALIPSRDEPFGLVAVEFGRKGALGIGARVGGLGQMPGWWYTVESMQTAHLLNQFKQAIDEALSSKHDLRAVMRARSAKQRFPVAQWREDLDILQSTAIRLHSKKTYDGRPGSQVFSARPKSVTTVELNAMFGEYDAEDLITMGNETHESIIESIVEHIGDDSKDITTLRSSPFETVYSDYDDLKDKAPLVTIAAVSSDENETDDDFAEADAAPTLSEARECEIVRVFNRVQLLDYAPQSRLLSADKVAGAKKDLKLQQVYPFFTDTNGEFYRGFEEKLSNIKSENSESDTCIEEYLIKSEKKFFSDYRNAKLGLHERTISLQSQTLSSDSMTAVDSDVDSHRDGSYIPNLKSTNKGWDLGDNYVPPTGLRKWMQIQVGDWPIYAFFLAFGQIIAANSYQITLLTGGIGRPADKVYGVCAVYLVASMIWWLVFRRLGSLAVLSLPFGFYGMAFLFIGLAKYGESEVARTWIQNFGTGAYAIASASGAFFFALNFGDEGGSTVRTWIFRACTIQGTQQIYVVLLWFWGSRLIQNQVNGVLILSSFEKSWKFTVVTLSVAGFLWTLGAVIYIGLPTYYRQRPGIMPGFYKTLTRRKIILWFFLSVIVQNFFLSTQYGRSWAFLFSSTHAATWQVVLLIVFFFVIIWIGLLWAFSHLTHWHSWILPIFAIGLGSPRWAQTWWAVSTIGQWLPWAPGGYIGSALFSRGLWLWLGVLDTVQGVGIGMILLSTMTRVHVLFTLVVAQMLGSMMTAVARAAAPNRVNPAPTFPDISSGLANLWHPWFWLGLLLNLGLCVGFFKFFRKEQLMKP